MTARAAQVLQGVRPIDRARLPKEAAAGITLAALAIPEVMGYSQIAGMPVITGLYTILLPVAVFAVLGSSRHLVVGADSATAAIMFAGLTGLAATASPQYVALAGLLALLAGGLLLLARLLRLGFLANFLSRTVLIGFLTGVGVQVACGQLAGMIGVEGGGSNPVDEVVNTLKELGDANAATVAVSAAVLLVIIAGGRLLPVVPWALVAVIGAIIASDGLDLASHGVAVLGTVPSGLPSFGLPDVSLSDVPELIGTAGSIFIVILAQSAATSRAYAAKFDEPFDENVDLVGLGLANASAGLTGTFVVNGSPTKTEMVDSAGGRSQLAQLTTAVVVVIVLLFLTEPLSYMPDAVLASVVFLIALRLVDIPGMRLVLHRRPYEFAVALVTALTVVFVGVEEGIILAIVLSVVIHLRHSYRPNDRLMVHGPDEAWRSVATDAANPEALPGLAIYRFGASLYYANASHFREELLALAARADPPLRWLCVLADAIGDIDFTGSATLGAVNKELDARGITLVLCGLIDPVRAELAIDGLLDAIGPEHVFETINAVQTAYETTGGAQDA